MRLILNDLNVRTCSTHLLAATLCELWHVAMYTEPCAFSGLRSYFDGPMHAKQCVKKMCAFNPVLSWHSWCEDNVHRLM